MHFQSLEVVDRGSETELQVTENVNCIPQRSIGLDYLNKHSVKWYLLTSYSNHLVFVNPTWFATYSKVDLDLNRSRTYV